jgi:hypothetical protein
MQEDQNVDVVRRAYEAFGRGDIQTLLGTCDENIDWITPGPAELPTAGHRRGRQEVARFFQELNDVFQVEQFTPRDFIAQGERVVVCGEEVARVRSTGKTIEITWAHVFELKDGQIVRFHEYLDTAPAVDALREAAAAAQA